MKLTQMFEELNIHLSDETLEKVKYYYIDSYTPFNKTLFTVFVKEIEYLVSVDKHSKFPNNFGYYIYSKEDGKYTHLNYGEYPEVLSWIGSIVVDNILKKDSLYNCSNL